MQKTILSVAAFLTLVMSSTYAEQHAHVHGTGELAVAIDGNMLQIDLDSPLDNLLGFEHAPRDEKEKRALQAMSDKLQQAGSLFVPTAAARCVAQPTQMTPPFFEAAGKKNDGHADVEATLSFRCEAPAALKDIDVKLFEAFPALHKLNVQLATPHGQSAATLTASQHKLAW
jgi:hypothetical protein